MDRQPRSFWWAVASAGAVVLGGFGPWAKILEDISVSGIDAGDGWIVVVAGFLAGGLIIVGQQRRWGTWHLAISLIAAAVAAVTAIYNWTDINRVSGELGFDGLVSTGWGLYLATFGSISLAAACIGLWVEGGPADEPAAETTPEPVADETPRAGRP